MSDLISRQAAIDAMAELQGRASTKAELIGISKAWKRIKKLPSAQPDVPDTNVGDMVSRQAAIDAVQESRRLNHHKDGKEACAHEYEHRHFLKLLMDLPSAQPEEVIPHRNYKYLSDYWCECGWHLGKKGDVKYCAECGRKVNWDE